LKLPDQEPLSKPQRELDHRSGIDLKSIENFVSSILVADGFKLSSPFTDRHGSWELKFYQSTGGLHRTIAIDFTRESSPFSPSPNPYTVEFWIGCEKDDKFLRHKTGEFNTTDDQLNLQKFNDTLKDFLLQAVTTVRGVTADQMTNIYEHNKLAF